MTCVSIVRGRRVIGIFVLSLKPLKYIDNRFVLFLAI